jgi:hypothetical protein
MAFTASVSRLKAVPTAPPRSSRWWYTTASLALPVDDDEFEDFEIIEIIPEYFEFKSQFERTIKDHIWTIRVNLMGKTELAPLIKSHL